MLQSSAFGALARVIPIEGSRGHNCGASKTIVYIYILTNTHGTLYIGVSADLASRLEAHAATEHNSFAHRYNCDRLIYIEHFHDYQSAILRKKQLKNWRRAKKVALIARVYPNWRTIPVPQP